MKKLAILFAVILFQTQVIAVSAVTNSNYNKQPAKKVQPQQVKQVKNQTTQTKPTSDNDDYLLKYNINDLEAAPWLNNGQRKL